MVPRCDCRRNPGERPTSLAPFRVARTACFCFPVQRLHLSCANMLARLLGQENPANWWHKWNTIKAINGTRTFGEINLDGPDQGADPSSVHTLGLRFKFVRHDTGQPVNIAWMQFSLFDFDHTNGKKQEGQEARATGAPPPDGSHPPTCTPPAHRPPTDRTHRLAPTSSPAR